MATFHPCDKRGSRDSDPLSSAARRQGNSAGTLALTRRGGDPSCFPPRAYTPHFRGGAAPAAWAPPRHVTGAGARLPRSMPGGCAPPSRGLPRVGGGGWGPAGGAHAGGQDRGRDRWREKCPPGAPSPPASPRGDPASARQRRAARTGLSRGREDRCPVGGLETARVRREVRPGSLGPPSRLALVSGEAQPGTHAQGCRHPCLMLRW